MAEENKDLKSSGFNSQAEDGLKNTKPAEPLEDQTAPDPEVGESTPDEDGYRDVAEGVKARSSGEHE